MRLPDDVLHAVLFVYMQPQWYPPIPAYLADAYSLLFKMRRASGEYQREFEHCLLENNATRIKWLLDVGAVKMDATALRVASAFSESALFWEAHVNGDVPPECVLHATRTRCLSWVKIVARHQARGFILRQYAVDRG